jgi:adenosyl cobinamide kinase/adenosyl cobinamide phosphate guanylyltransferase
MRLRVEAHRASRPAAWRTVEEPIDLLAALSAGGAYDACVLDCVTLWISNLLLAGGEAEEPGPERVTAALDAVRGLIARQREHSAAMIAVSNEVGSGLVPEYPLGRVYRDALGEANQLLAAAADRAYLCVAGYALDLKAGGRRLR